jgi:hypothetical protein
MAVPNHGAQRRSHKLLASWGMSDPVRPGSVKSDPPELEGYRTITCPDCGGAGFESIDVERPDDNAAVLSCMTCHGTGRVNESELTP